MKRKGDYLSVEEAPLRAGEAAGKLPGARRQT